MRSHRILITDALGQLATAETTGAGGWGQSFLYDGFGNLRQQNITKGTAPMVNLTIDATFGHTNSRPRPLSGALTAA